ncbi:DUF1572 family protein [Ferruginibacter paludis]|uniref:DUF1572 family protein n=1 Tax=Ferruginibacter paludis TaxID=1310417 RepID=UPI0025B4E306|nr:DUF1572 family protein [Ferruginibacter paludis]MDN3655115.1 DUF1572 family protein [Ferruginibacter paludis]
MDLATTFLQSAIKRVAYYKELGDKTFAQLSEADFFFTPNKENNSIAVIIQHMAGNMLSRWTDFLTTDGEKEWRNRDSEFEEQPLTKQQLIELWERGWNCFLGTLRQLNGEDLLKTIYIRHEAIPAVDAINRQLAHYPYHVGQIIYIGKIRKDQNWQSLSIPKGNSDQYNQQLFSANADKLKS